MYLYVYDECVRVWYSRLKKYVNDTVKSFCVVIMEDYMKVILGAGVYKLKKKCRSSLKILGSRRVTRRKFHTKGPEILGGTVKNFVATATCRLGFVRFCGYRRLR